MMVNMKKILFLFLALFSFSGMVYSDITWSTPVAISTALTTASDPHVVIDVNGNATAAWVENNAIKASSLPFGGSWSTPVTLSNVSNTSSTPRLGVDSSGNVTALWIENTQIESATLPFGGSWGAETSPISGTGASNPSFAVDASGNAVAVWVRSGFIESSTRISGTWSLVSVLSATNSSNPHVAISSFGTAMAVWHSVVSGNDLIVTDILTISSNTWAATKNVFSGTATFNHNYPKVAIDANGNAAVAWFRYNFFGGNNYQNVQVITSALSQGASAWGIPNFLSNQGIRNPADLTIKLKFDTSGDALIFWTNSYDGELFTIESSVKLVGGVWQLSSMVDSPSLYSFGIDSAIAAANALLVEMTWDGVSNINIRSIQTDSTNPGSQFFTIPNQISTGSDNAYPSCGFSVNGSALNAVVVWLNFNGSNVVINASSGTDSVIGPPSSVSATQSNINYGVYDDFINTITWSASTDPNVIQYNVYRNGVIVAELPASTLQFVDHNQVQSGHVTYGVAGFTGNDRQSAIITFTLF